MNTRSSLRSALQASLLDSASALLPADFDRQLDVALADFSRYRPLTQLGQLKLMAGQAVYPAPAGVICLLGLDWGRSAKAALQPWDEAWPGPLPVMQLLDGPDGSCCYLQPPPSGRQIQLLGSLASYRYGVAQRLDEQGCTVAAGDIGLLLLRAQAEVMRELAIKHSTKPLQMRDGISSTPRNGTPSYLHTVLMEEFERRMQAC